MGRNFLSVTAAEVSPVRTGVLAWDDQENGGGGDGFKVFYGE